MLCLQRKLVPFATGKQSTNCEKLRSFAFGTHSDCYVDNGVCVLGPDDWLKIFQTVGINTLFGSWDAFKQTLQTAGGCIELFFWIMSQLWWVLF